MFWHRVAREILHCTIDEALDRVDSEQFAELKAVYGLEPWGDEWKRTGLIASLSYNRHRSRGAEAMAPSDWIPKIFDAEKLRQSPAKIMNCFRMLFAMLKGSRKVADKGEHK